MQSKVPLPQTKHVRPLTLSEQQGEASVIVPPARVSCLQQYFGVLRAASGRAQPKHGGRQQVCARFRLVSDCGKGTKNAGNKLQIKQKGYAKVMPRKATAQNQWQKQTTQKPLIRMVNVSHALHLKKQQ